MEWFIPRGVLSKVEQQAVQSKALHLKGVVQNKLWSAAECSVCLPSYDAGLKEVLSLASKKQSSDLKMIVVIGIGGSNLGSKAVYEALGSHVDMIFLDTCDQALIDATAKKLSQLETKNELLLCVISKSGGTVETVMDAELLLQKLRKKFGFLQDRMVAITDKNSSLWNWAEREQISTLAIPPLVGGRYSVFSAVGLFPLAMAGLDVKRLLKGAQAMLEQEWKKPGDGLAAQSAAAVYQAWRKKKTIYDHFFFIPAFESVGKWCRQLVAESLGKKGRGITPTVSVGSTDLHSMSQLYLDGPQSSWTLFVSDQIKQKGDRISKKPIFDALVKSYAGRTAADVLAMIVEGTKVAYMKKHKPFSAVRLSRSSPFDLGFFMQWKMVETMFLGELMRVNAFDQPAVELYKREVRKLLS